MNNHTKSAEYRLQDGGTLIVSYDPEEPCICCELPVENASMGGTRLCPICDMGYRRSPKCPPGSKPRQERRFQLGYRGQQALQQAIQKELKEGGD